jgi:hypothetical protein
VALGKVDVQSRQAAAPGRGVHHVVVYEREQVQQLERGAGVDNVVVVLGPTRAHVGSHAERGPQAFAAAQGKPVQGDERLGEERVDGGPAFGLGGE